jgi:hypothetical protein
LPAVAHPCQSPLSFATAIGFYYRTGLYNDFNIPTFSPLQHARIDFPVTAWKLTQKTMLQRKKLHSQQSVYLKGEG